MSATVAQSVRAEIRERVEKIETMPSVPAVFLPLFEMLNLPPDAVKLEEIVKLVSYDNTIAAQCLRVASSPLFGLSKAPDTIKAAVISLGLRRVQTILLTCCMGKAFPAKNWPLNPIVFWRHSLGCAMVCRKFSEKLGAADGEKAYVAGLMHDIGFMVNCVAFAEEFRGALKCAVEQQIPLHQAEFSKMGFSHSETGHALAQIWHMSSDILQVIAEHHDPAGGASAPLVALVHLSDLLCRMRSLGYGYYERQKVDLAADPAWGVLLKEYKRLEGVDLVRFTFELDDALEEISQLVTTILG